MKVVPNSAPLVSLFADNIEEVMINNCVMQFISKEDYDRKYTIADGFAKKRNQELIEVNPVEVNYSFQSADNGNSTESIQFYAGSDVSSEESHTDADDGDSSDDKSDDECD